MELPKSKIAIITSVSQNNIIGKDNKIPWTLSDDLKRFKLLTEGHVIIMGQKTFESLGKPLPNRINIILTNNYDYNPDFPNDEIYIVHSIEHALNTADYYNDNDLEVFVIGGGTIYQKFMKYCYRLYITRIFKDFDGDTYFPVLDPYWRLIWCDSRKSPDFDYEYQIYNINYE